jgi:Protein of unknown function (DUF4058)
MPSPFPGMDPYLESPDIWPDLHDALASGIRSELNQTLPAAYYARLEMRKELGIIEEPGERQRIIPDIAVVSRPIPQPRTEVGGMAVATRSRRDVSRPLRIKVLFEPIRHLFVEIRDPSRGHKLITLIEILSPSDKRPGSDREAYESKQREVLESDASLIELDLLRGGKRILPDLGLKVRIDQLEPSPLYVVLVNRAWRRDGGVDYDVYPIGLRDSLPCISVPLKEGEDEIALDLQDIFDRAYDSGPYRRGAVDYAGSVPAPALDDNDAAWAAELTRPWREAKSEVAGAG